MAHKYYEGRKDRMDESRGMKKYEKDRKHSSHGSHGMKKSKDRMDESRGMKRYEENDSRGMKRYEKDMMDSKYYGMISEDHYAPANLPQEVVHKYYPKRDYFNSHYLDDSIRGIDDTRNDTIRNMERYESDVKI